MCRQYHYVHKDCNTYDKQNNKCYTKPSCLLFKLLNFCHQLLLPKCKYRCSTTNMNINIPRQQCRYINSENEKPHRPSPPHASICMLDNNTNIEIGISKKSHNLSLFILSIGITSFFGCKDTTIVLEFAKAMDEGM